METQRILVTGAAGFIGCNIALELQKQGHEVIALDNFEVGVEENLQEFEGRIVDTDIRSFKWQNELGKEKPDAIIHEAAITDTTVKDRELMMAVNFDAFKKIVDFSEKKNVNLVYASSAAIYGRGKVPMKEEQEKDILSYYAESKLEMDKFSETKFADFEKKGLKLVGLRYFNVYGPREAHKGKMASMIWQLYLRMQNGRPRIFKNGEQTRDQIYVKDCVAATLLALKAKKNEVYNVGSGKETSFNKIIELLNKNLGKNLQPEYIENPYSHFQNATCADLAKAKKFLLFNPKWSIEEGIKDYVKFLRR